MTVDAGCGVDIDPDLNLVALHWNGGPPVGDARELVDRARRVDTEMSFVSIADERLHQDSSCTVEVFTRLRRWSAPRTDDPALAAVLTFTRAPAGGPIVMQAVVDPDFRSAGVITAAFEALGTMRHFGSGVSGDVIACAFGSHPAALRAAARFGATIAAERDVLVPQTAPSYSANGSDGLRTVRCNPGAGAGHAHSVWRHLESVSEPAVYSAMFDSGPAVGHFALEQCAETTRLTIRGVRPGSATPTATVHDVVRTAASLLLRDRDPTQVEVTVDTGDRLLLEALRSAGFHHDRTDVAFALRATPDLVTPHQ